MTKEQKVEMFSLRLDGNSLQDIGNRFGCSREYVRQIVGNHAVETKRIIKAEKIKYPGIRNWAAENSKSIPMLAKMSGIKQSTLYRGLTHGTEVGMHMDTIKGILRATGLTFEEAFGICES